MQLGSLVAEGKVATSKEREARRKRGEEADRRRRQERQCIVLKQKVRLQK